MALSQGQQPSDDVKTKLNGSATTSTPTKPSASGETNWESHPIYQALSSRLSATESAVASLSSQVSHLQNLIEQALPSLAPLSTQSAPEGDSVAALTQQISALSTSVAQLQRLQSQSTLSRQHSNAGRPDRDRDQRSNAATPTPGLSLSSVPPNIYNTGPLTAPHPGPFGPKHHPREFLARPPVPRSISSSIVQTQEGQQDKTWGPPVRTPGTGGMMNPLSPGPWPSPLPTTPNNAGPAGAMTPSISGPGLNGPSAPGAGIVVTKWEHLNLKPDLVRSIQKYG